jgi:hypothetical protein
VALGRLGYRQVQREGQAVAQAALVLRNEAEQHDLPPGYSHSFQGQGLADLPFQLLQGFGQPLKRHNRFGGHHRRAQALHLHEVKAFGPFMFGQLGAEHPAAAAVHGFGHRFGHGPPPVRGDLFPAGQHHQVLFGKAHPLLHLVPLVGAQGRPV